MPGSGRTHPSPGRLSPGRLSPGIVALGLLFGLFGANALAADGDTTTLPLSQAEQRERSVTLMIRPRLERQYAVAWSAVGNLVRGNRDIDHLDTSLSGAMRFGERWAWTLEGRLLLDVRFDVQTAQLWALGQRLDWFLSNRSSVFVEGTLEHDAFLGLQRQWIATVGINRNLLYVLGKDGALQQWFGVEAGIMPFQQEFQLSPRAPPGTVLQRRSKRGLGLSGSAWYEWLVAPGTAMGIEVEVRSDLFEPEDTAAVISLYAGASVLGPLSVRLFATWSYDGRPPTAIDHHDFFLLGAFRLALERFTPPVAE